MGNECSEEEREFRYSIFHQAIYLIEKDINNELFSQDLSKKKYSPFGLVNKELVLKYPFLLNETFDKNEARKKIFNYKDLVEKIIDKEFTIGNKPHSFGFPSDFIFVNQDFFDVINNFIPNYYRKYLTTVYQTIIGGQCLIMKDAKDYNDDFAERYIILYHEIKENVGNEIDFFLFIKDRNDRKAAVDYILQYNLWNYFQKIGYDYNNKTQNIYNRYKKSIGYIVRCSSVSRIITKINSKRSQIPSGSSNTMNKKQNRMKNPGTMMPVNPQASLIKRNPSYILDPVISFFFLIDELKLFLNQNINLDYKSFENIIISKVGQNLKMAQNYQQIFDLILTNLDPNTKEKKVKYDQSSQYFEEKGFKNFMENHQNGNEIQKLFLIPKESKIYCNRCKMKTYQFYYRNYILIRNGQQDTLKKIIFESTNEHHKKTKICTSCSGQETECSVEKIVIGYPKWLIVIIEPNEVNNFNLEMNSIIVNNEKKISYSFSRFIDAKTYSFYKINERNIKYCHKFNNKMTFDSPEELNNKKPIVLFYKLINDVPINQNNIQNFPIQNNQNIVGQNNAGNITNINRQNFSQQNPPQNNVQSLPGQTNNQQIIPNPQMVMNQQNMQNPQQNNNNQVLINNMNPQMVMNQQNMQNPQQNNNNQMPINNMNPQMVMNQQNIQNPQQNNSNQMLLNNMNPQMMNQQNGQNFQQNFNNQMVNNINAQMVNQQNAQNMNQQNLAFPNNNFQNGNFNNNFSNNMNNNFQNGNIMFAIQGNNMNNINSNQGQNVNMNFNNNANNNFNMNNNQFMNINNNNFSNGAVNFQAQNNINMNNNNINNNNVNNNINNNNVNNNMMNNNMNLNMNNNWNMNNNMINNNNMMNNNVNNNMMNNNMNNNNMNIFSNKNLNNCNNMNMGNNMNINNMNMMGNNMNIANNMNMGNNMNNGNNMNMMGNNMNVANNMNMGNNMNNGNKMNMIGNNINIANNMNNGNNINIQQFPQDQFNNNQNQVPNQNQQNAAKNEIDPKNLIFITFTFEQNKKQIYIDADKNETFNNVLLQLEEKYNWLRNIKKKTYIFKGKPIPERNYSETLQQLQIKDNSDISISMK